VTLLEIGKLISSAFPQVSRPNTRLSFRLLYSDSYRGRILLKDIGTVHMTPGQEGEDAGSRTLEDVKYVIGDFVNVAIFGSGQGAPPRPFDGPRGSFSRQGGGMDRGRGRSDSYRGSMRGRGGRNGYDGRLEEREERGPPSGPRRDRDRDPDRDRDRW
jgi:histone deacetylase complex subunit SAP18